MKQHQKVGRWTLRTERGDRWLCICDCGSTRHVLTANLKKRTSLSCGCATSTNHRKVMASVFGEVQHGIR
jgi:hypothetical protein